MYVIFLLLALIGTSKQQEQHSCLYPPCYVQARTAFSHARLFLQESVPYEERNITNPEARKHFSFGMIAAVTIALVEAFDSITEEYEPLKVFLKTVPDAWESYSVTAERVNSLLGEADIGIRPITTLIDVFCDISISIEDCNLKVHEYLKDDRFLRRRAQLLLQLGRAAKIVNNEERKLITIANSNNAIPYLYKNVDTTPYEIFIAEATRTLNLLRPNEDLSA